MQEKAMSICSWILWGMKAQFETPLLKAPKINRIEGFVKSIGCKGKAQTTLKKLRLKNRLEVLAEIISKKLLRKTL